MLRATEIALFLAPFGLFLLWRFLAPKIRPAILWAGIVMIIVLAGTAIFFGLRQRMDPHARYLPAHMENGHIVPGRAEP